jgi:hypothetical protein
MMDSVGAFKVTQSLFDGDDMARSTVTTQRTKRATAEPRWKSNAETWSQFQCRHYKWRKGLPSNASCVRAAIPVSEGKVPASTAKDTFFQVGLSVLGGGPFNPVVGGRFAGAGSVAVISRPGGGLRFDMTVVGERIGGARPAAGTAPKPTSASAQSPMDTTSPPRSSAQSPMDTTSPPRSSAQSPMDTTSPPRSNAQSPMSATPSSPASGPKIDVDTPASPGLYSNEKGMLEKKTFSTVYRVAPASARDAIRQHGFAPSGHFGGIDKMISGDALIVSETADGARIFGDSEYGPGCYDLYEIDASGFKGASLQDNVDFNTRVIATRLGYTPEALESMPPREVAEGALEFREAHVDAGAGDPRRVKIIEYGTLPPRVELNASPVSGESSGGSQSDGDAQVTPAR